MNEIEYSGRLSRQPRKSKSDRRRILDVDMQNIAPPFYSLLDVVEQLRFGANKSRRHHRRKEQSETIHGVVYRW